MKIQAFSFRPLIGSIIARGIHSMALSLSGTHAFNDQKFLLHPKLTGPKEQCQHLEKSSKKLCVLVKDNYPKKNALLRI